MTKSIKPSAARFTAFFPFRDDLLYRFTIQAKEQIQPSVHLISLPRESTSEKNLNFKYPAFTLDMVSG